MCIAIHAPIGRQIPLEHLRESFNSNPHGAGFAYASEGKVITVKGFFDFDSFMKAFEPLNGNVNCLVHFRWATHGAHNVDNCHPWPVGENHAMIHNGIISGYGKFKNGRSDTGDFADFLLTPMLKDLPDNAFGSPWMTEVVSRAIGDGNKMAVINGNGKVAIFNQHLGHWNNGVWYSNTDYIPAPPKRVRKKKE